jgi:NitT/TauT family transport system permease protein
MKKRNALSAKKTLEVAGVLLAALIIWEIAVRWFQPQAFILPAPSMIAVEFTKSPAYLLRHTMFTLSTTLAGFVLALFLGFIAAVGIVYSKFLERTLFTLLVALNSIPKVALAPLFVIWMGTGAEPKIAIALTIAIFATVIDTVLGLRSVDPELLQLAQTAHASGLKVLIKLRLPGALPSMFAGMKIGISLALVGAIVGEFVAGDTGLGQVILQAQGMFQTPRVFAAVIILGMVGTILFYAIEWLERLLIPWHVSQRGTVVTHGG